MRRKEENLIRDDKEICHDCIIEIYHSHCDRVAFTGEGEDEKEERENNIL